MLSRTGRGRDGESASGGRRTALQEAGRMLSRRPLAAEELRRRLRDRGYPEADVEETVLRLTEDGYLDDLELSYHYITVRAERKRHGPARLIRELVGRGVPRETAEAALQRALDEGAVDPERMLREEVRKRVAAEGGSLGRRSMARVYNALLRSGFEPHAIRGALEPDLRGSGEAASEFDDDVT